jgi:GntR family transcriptional regulator
MMIFFALAANLGTVTGMGDWTGRHNVRTIKPMSWNEGNLAPDAAPLWRQIADRLRRSIATGEFRPGDVLPSEMEINATFQVSRATARASLERLRHEGLIRRQSGRGSIVLAPKVEQPVNELASFSEDMRRRGLRPSYSTFSAESALARGEAAEALEIGEGELALHIRRLLLADDEPIGMSESWLAPWIFAAARQPTPDELDAGSLYEWLARFCGQRIAGARECIEAALADAAMARRLGVAPGSALLVARRRSHAENQRPIEYAVMHYRADRYRFIIELAGNSAPRRMQ